VRIGITLAVALIWASGAVVAQGLKLDDVMRRAHLYIVEYEDRLSHVLAEERYEQRIVDPGGATLHKRTLVSDYVVFQIPPDESWYAFRDVFEVDGEPVRDRQQRLQELFARRSADTVAQAMKIAEESARHNIGDVPRTINLPTFPLSFLRPANRSRFRFEKLGEEVADGVLAWVIGYRETKNPTFISTTAGVELKAHGRFSLDPTDGRLFRSELVTGGDRALAERATITVMYRPDPNLGLWVPGEMQELYDNPRRRKAANVIHGRATYSNYRRVERKPPVRRDGQAP